jgi:PIN domain nuclease of toxin-antitoxin system
MERYLLDTMTVLWMAFEPDRLGGNAAALLEADDTDLAYSTVSLWEIGLKMGRGGYHGFRPADCRRLQNLPSFHKDPFDRMLIAQALEESRSVIGCDGQFDAYGVRRIW